MRRQVPSIQAQLLVSAQSSICTKRLTWRTPLDTPGHPLTNHLYKYIIIYLIYFKRNFEILSKSCQFWILSIDSCLTFEIFRILSIHITFGIVSASAGGEGGVGTHSLPCWGHRTSLASAQLSDQISYELNWDILRHGCVYGAYVSRWSVASSAMCLLLNHMYKLYKLSKYINQTLITYEYLL